MINSASIIKFVFIVALFLCLTSAFAHGRPKSSIDRKLVEACAQGDLEAVRHLLSEGANPNAVDPKDGRTPLTEIAGHRNSAAIITLLAKHGADLNAYDNDGQTPLISAASFSDLPAVKTLLALGAKVDEKDKDGQTALFQLDGANSLEIAQVLLDHHADPKAKDKEGGQPILNAENIPCVQLLLEQGVDINAQDNSGLTLLSLTGGGVDFVKYLLDHGANPNIRDAGGMPAWMEHLYDGASIIKLFLDHGWT